VYPRVTAKHDLVAHDGELVEIVGTYQAIDTRPHPNLRREPDGRLSETFVVGRIKLEDGTRIRLGPRPDEELDQLDGVRVVATGRLERSPRLPVGTAQQPSSKLHDIQSVSICSE
jgi:hypothetical protein